MTTTTEQTTTQYTQRVSQQSMELSSSAQAPTLVEPMKDQNVDEGATAHRLVGREEARPADQVAVRTLPRHHSKVPRRREPRELARGHKLAGGPGCGASGVGQAVGQAAMRRSFNTQLQTKLLIRVLRCFKTLVKSANLL